MILGWDNPTADPTTTVLLRHGDTQLSPEHRFSGLRDLPLSANGTRQAKAAAGRLASGAPIDAVVSSPLQRAVATAAIAAGEQVTISIRDDGSGFPPGDEDRVFEKFFRGKSDGVRGLGLGLAICRAIIHGHQGTIFAENRPEGGATVHFELPIGGAPPQVEVLPEGSLA